MTGIIVAASLLLLSGHLLLKSYMPNVAFGAVGFFLVILVFCYVLLVRRDLFGFVMLVYICSHFSYADYQGGLWNLTAFGLLVLNMLMGRKLLETRRSDTPMNLLLGFLVLWNVLGWVLKNPLPPVPVAQGAAMFLGFILVYQVAAHLDLSRERIRIFLVIMFLLLGYQFLVALNQRYQLLYWNTPLLGSYSDFGTKIVAGTVNTPGTINHFELFGEYGTLMLCLLVPLLSSSAMQRELRIKVNHIVWPLFISLIIPMMTSTRSAALLAAFTLVVYYIVFSMRMFSGVDRLGRQLRIIAVVGILLPLVGVYLGMRHLEEDFSSLEAEEISAMNIVGGSSINRGTLTSMALDRIGSESWLIGHGMGIVRSNQWAWFGRDSSFQYVSISDFHSLYFSIPMLYGWPGSVAFLCMIVLTLYRLINVALRYRHRKSIHCVLAVGFAMFWFVFLADQYKISIIRNPGYHMLFWIWLGLSNALVRTLRHGSASPAAMKAQAAGTTESVA